MLESRNSIDLKVIRWSAWSPGIADRQAWQAWADGAETPAEPAEPDVRFVERLLRRRLSRLSRMVFRVASDCLESQAAGAPLLNVFCSRYGEFSRAFEMLAEIAKEQPLSPMAFSLSVHNTACSLFSIMRQDHSHATALAAGEATLEAGFLEAWSLLREGSAEEVLLVYGDRPLPALYAPQDSTIGEPIALAFLLRLPRDSDTAPRLALTWRASVPAGATPLGGEGRDEQSATSLGVLKLLLKGGEPIDFDSGRLTWTWTCDAQPA